MKTSMVALRHFETLKNKLDIHGKSDLRQLTVKGYEQLKQARTHLETLRFLEGVTYFPTPQAERSAELLARELALPLDPPLTLEPYDFGIADGISTAELERLSPTTAASLQLFRERVIDASRLNIPGGESAEALEHRLLKWWHTEGKDRTNNKAIVGSSSTLLMLTNFMDGHLPTSGRYFCQYIRNGAVRAWTSPRNIGLADSATQSLSWPDISTERIRSELGYVQVSRHRGSWGNSGAICIIAPGYFGNSRQGPYGLYSKLARELSKDGIETVTVDYLGSGESSALSRSFSSDFTSILAVVHTLSEGRKVILIGHSMGASVVAHALSTMNRAIGIAIAPLVSLTGLAQALFTGDEVEDISQDGFLVRRGVRIDRNYVSDSEHAWRQHSHLLSHIVTAAEDQYDPGRIDLKLITHLQFSSIQGADHNFSVADSSSKLIDLLCRLSTSTTLDNNSTHKSRRAGE